MDPVYSPWWKRVCAALLDGVIVGIPSGIVFAIFGSSVLRTDPVTGLVEFHVTGGYVAAWLLTLVITFGYYTILEGGNRAATVGKMALNITVRDASTFGRIGYGRALARRLLATVLWYLLILPGLLDVLSPLWDRRRQTWHDKAVRAVVVDKA